MLTEPATAASAEERRALRHRLRALLSIETSPEDLAPDPEDVAPAALDADEAPVATAAPEGSSAQGSVTSTGSLEDWSVPSPS